MALYFECRINKNALLHLAILPTGYLLECLLLKVVGKKKLTLRFLFIYNFIYFNQMLIHLLAYVGFYYHKIS